MLVEYRERILGDFKIKTRQRAPRSADQIERQARAIARPALGAQHLADRALERLRAVLAQRGEAQHAEREAVAAPDFAIRHLRKFEAATAEVDRDAVRIGNRRDHAKARSFGFFLSGQEANRQAGIGGARNEVGSVGCIAYRSGGDALQVLHLHEPRQQRVAAERIETALGIFGSDPAIDRKPAAEAAWRPFR